MFTDFNDLNEFREKLKRERPERFIDENGQHHSNIFYGNEYGRDYAEISWTLPVGCHVTLEDHGNNPELGVPTGVRFWL
jgi:hypothetical protein